jgi:hypothetical protein
MSIAVKLRRVANRAAQMLDPDTKIFFIGFNRTATISLHLLMQKARIRSVHWRENGPDSPNVAREIDHRISDDRALKAYMGQWTAFSDLSGGLPGQSLDGNRHFRRFDQLFPRSYFVLNDRDTEAWIRSRTAFQNGALIPEHAEHLGVSESRVPDVWRALKVQHTADVLEYFQGRKRFLHFRIDADPPDVLTSFLWPSFVISPRWWRHSNQTVVDNGGS